MGNKYAKGQPFKYTDPKVFEEKANEYFNATPEERITLTGLLIHLDISKPTLASYLNKEGFKDIILKAKIRIEHAYELSLREKGGAGNIFALKNFGWQDKTETEIYGKNGGPIEHSDLTPEQAYRKLMDD